MQGFLLVLVSTAYSFAAPLRRTGEAIAEHCGALKLFLFSPLHKPDFASESSEPRPKACGE